MGCFSSLCLPSLTVFPRPGVLSLVLNILLLLISKVYLKQGVILGGMTLRFS